MSSKAKLRVQATAHAIRRLAFRFPQFRYLTQDRRAKAIELIGFLGQRLKRICNKAQGNQNIYVRGKNLFQSGEDIILVLRRHTTKAKKESLYRAVTVLSYPQFIEYRRASRESRPLRKDER